MKISIKFVEELIGLAPSATEGAELLKAQHAAFSRQLPVMYFILLTSTWSVAVTHLSRAPVWLTIGVPSLLTLGCATRIRYWWRSRKIETSAEAARLAFLRTNRLAVAISVAFTAWALTLYAYGGAYEKSQVAFYMAVTGIGCIFSLMYLRSAALRVGVIVNVAFIVFFAASGEPTLIATAINMLFVTVALIVVVFINYRSFNQMIEAQVESRHREQHQRRLMRMIDDMPVAVMTVDLATFRINYVNETSRRTLRGIEHLLPIAAHEIVGTSVDVFHSHPQFQRAIISDAAKLPHRARIRLGPEVLDLQISAVNDSDGSYIGPMLSWSVATRQVEAEERIYRLAHFDSLTDLPNRATFLNELEANLARASGVMGLLSVDLDGFKVINDTRGHRTGDELLKQVAARLQRCCASPGMTLGRIGGDEFAVLLADTDANATLRFGASLVKTLAAPYVLEGNRQGRISASVGCALAPYHGDASAILLSRVDMALYAAKAAGKGTCRMFAPEMEMRMLERHYLEASLRDALEKGDGLFVFYQPIVDINTKRTTAREALIRWHHRQLGWVSPHDFIPVAEETELIIQVGLFVLQCACRDALAWSDEARVAVNVSAAQLGRGTLVPAVQATLHESGLPPNRLEIEVTETALLANEDEIIGDLRTLRGLGVRVALDDFGTGYSSLAHLRNFPFDKIKIDASFVRDAVTRPDCMAVIKAIADIGKVLGVVTIAEGVETEEQLATIATAGCSEAQGFLFGRPMPAQHDLPRVLHLLSQIEL